MEYTLEKIYRLVGQLDQVATLTFRDDSDAFQTYGDLLTVVFTYDQVERETMDKLILNDQSNTHGRIKAKYLGIDLPDDKIKQLLEDGINSEDIIDVFHFHFHPKTNTFHSTEKRVLNKHIIEMEPLPKGGDLGWMFGFQDRLVRQGIGLSPNERNFYLAGKFYFETQDLKEQEKNEIFDESGLMKDSIELEFLTIKGMREEINEEELKKLNALIEIKESNRINTLDSYLGQAGSSLKKLSEKNPEQAKRLINKVMRFNDSRLNVIGKHPIYMDIDSYLHIYMRHVEEYKVNKHFENKDNFQWDEEDVFLVMKNVIQEIEDDYQKYREEKPNLRFSRYDKQSIYFQGDYYTLHVDTTGRISTFHKNRKELDK